MARAIDPDNLDPELRLMKSSDEAWLADLALIRELTRQEKQAEEDRALAARLAGITLNDVPEDLRKLAMLIDDYDDDDGEEEDDDETINRRNIVTNTTTMVQITPSTYQDPKTVKKKCAVCMEFVIKQDPRAPCGHAYCRGCLKDLFMASMQDETLMPPRCCRQEIPLDLVRFTPREAESFKAKRLEYGTTNRLYCSQPTCSTFIPPLFIVNNVGTCPNMKCRMTTCSICKAASHGNLECPKDEATLALLNAAKEAGWPRCYRCKAVVELTQGCYHMTCRCRAEFCYLCSTPWKNCLCVQWDEARLLEEARVLTVRAPVQRMARADNDINLQLRIENMANQLRANYECRHTGGWAYTPGGGRCEECHNYLRQYLFRCHRCHLMACNRCRRNRF